MPSCAITVFLLCTLALLYIAAGYPLLLEVLAALRPRPARAGPQEPTVTVLLPVRNGALWIRDKLHSILAMDYPPERMQVVVISDDSDDGTDDVVREFAHAGVTLVRVPLGGKARALNAGLERATGEILFYTDVRQHLEPSGLRRLVTYFADPEVGVVSGELVIRDGPTHEERHTGLYWKWEKRNRRNLSRIDSVPGATGCIFTMRRSLAAPMPPDTLLDDVYLPMRAVMMGYRALWTDEAKAYDLPTSLAVEYRRKVRTEAGVYQLLFFIPALLSPFHNRIWIHFVSHRIGRLALPFLLLGVLLASFGLPSPWNALALAGQAGFYLLAAADPWVSERNPLKRLTSICRLLASFVLAALVAASILVRPARSFWKVTRIGDANP